MVSADGGTSQRLLPESEAGIDPTWSPDGNSVLFGQLPGPDSRGPKTVLQIYDLRTLSVAVVPGSEGLHSPRWSPDGRYIRVCPRPNSDWYCSTSKLENGHSSLIGYRVAELVAGFQVRLFLAFNPNLEGVFRLAISNHKLEVDLKDFRPAGTWGAWFSLTPEDEPLVLRDVGPPEILCASWDAP